MSGATPLAACAPHRRRFGLHPLQTFRNGGGPEQFDGTWGAISGETPEARSRAAWLAGELGLRTFELNDEHRALYHLGATLASNYVVTLYKTAERAVAKAGVPAEALLPLIRRTIDNGFDLTGPIARGDWGTVEMHLRAIRTQMPDVETLYRALAEATARDLQETER